MDMSIDSPSARGGSVRALSTWLYRRPTLYLLLLLVPPLLWFGAVYLGSLLTLLWQGFYTFDDFTMAVTPDLTFANLAALFNPANYDIILRTLTMAVLVSLASAVLAFPIAYYMARYTSGRVKAFFYIAVMMPMWASYIVKAYAWTLLLAKDGVAQWFLQHLGLEPLLASLLTVPGVGGNTLSTSGLGRFLVFVYIWLPFMILPIQAALERLPPSLLHASADLGAAGADLPPRHFAAGGAGHRRRVDLHLFADAGRLYRAAAGGAAGLFHRQHGLRPAGRDRQYADGRGLYAGADRSDRHLPFHRQTSGGFRCTLNARP